MSIFRTTAQVAADLNVSEWWVRNMAKTHGIGFNVKGKAGWRFSQADVDALIAATRPTPLPPRQRRRRAG